MGIPKIPIDKAAQVVKAGADATTGVDNATGSDDIAAQASAVVSTVGAVASTALDLAKNSKAGPVGIVADATSGAIDAYSAGKDAADRGGDAGDVAVAAGTKLGGTGAKIATGVAIVSGVALAVSQGASLAKATGVGFVVGAWLGDAPQAIAEGKSIGEVYDATLAGKLHSGVSSAVDAHNTHKELDQQFSAKTESRALDDNGMPKVGNKDYNNLASFAYAGTGTSQLSDNPELAKHGIKKSQDPAHMREEMDKLRDKIEKTPDDRSWFQKTIGAKHPAHYDQMRLESGEKELEAYEDRFNRSLDSKGQIPVPQHNQQNNSFGPEVLAQASKIGGNLAANGTGKPSEEMKDSTPVNAPQVADRSAAKSQGQSMHA